jgi:hypothetical protein
MNQSPFALITRRILDFIARSSEDGAANAELEGEFNDLAMELYRLQFAAVAPYRYFCERRGAVPATVQAWHEIPALPVSAFKQADVTSLSPEDRSHVFYSSGTTKEVPSRHYNDGMSLDLYEESIGSGFRIAWQAAPPQELLFLTPPADAVPHSSLVYMFNTLRLSFGNARSEFFGNVDAVCNWQVRVEDLVRRLAKCVRGSAPLTLMGTAFNFVHLLDSLAAKDQRLELPAGSMVLETGGYKGRSRVLSKPELHHQIAEHLGVPQSRIFSEYGMCELGSQAYDAQQRGVFQFPPWAYCRVVSPENGEPCPRGESGVLQVFDLANVRSVLAIQTEDVAVFQGDGFQLLGRAGESERRGCSLMSA